MAGKRAKASTAYASALTYFSPARRCCRRTAGSGTTRSASRWSCSRAECEFLTGELAAAETRLAALARRAASLPDLAAVTWLRMDLVTTRRAIEVGLDYLRRVGIEWSAHPTTEEVRQEYERMWRQIGEPPDRGAARPAPDDRSGRVREPWTSSPCWCRPPGSSTRTCAASSSARMANLSLEHGNSDASCLAYIVLGTVLGPDFGDYEAGYRFAQLGLDLVEKRGLDRFKARVYLGFGTIAGRGMSGPAARCCGGPSTRRSRPATSSTPASAATTSSRTFSPAAIRSPRCSGRPRPGSSSRDRRGSDLRSRPDHRAAAAHPDAARTDARVRLLR